MVVVGEGWAPGMVSPVVVAIVAVTCCRTAVVMVIVRIHIQFRFLVLILNPGQTQGYV